MRRRGLGPGTTAVHAGEAVDPETGAVITPVYLSSTFAYPDTPNRAGGWTPSRWMYTRYSNPTVAAAEAKVAALEGAEACLAFASGMGAMAAAVLAPLRPGQRVAAMSGIYGGTRSLLARQVAALGFGVQLLDTLDAGAFADALDEGTRVVVTEVPTTPLNRVFDVAELARRLRRRWGRRRPLVVTDATFATPLNFRPLAAGADVSHHSATKYLNGHTDLVGGVVSGRRAALAPLESWRRAVGACMDPHPAFLLSRGLRTLEVRLRRAEKNASAVAAALEDHRKVGRVWHLSLRTHPDHARARRLLRGPGAIVAFDLKSARRASARKVMRALRLFAPAPSLGGVESLVSLPSETSHAALSPAERRREGIGEGTVRLAVGIETAADLVDDLRSALRAA